ncbi:hypothetical protein IP90_02348 [Luteimonas cucumeris]|uniref:DUF6868 domain-containing protein n=1 Tax=Luteimonas cucumeris TaxID=985012 RepID=A0A562L2D9_9GAMM|nr:hypothetical protein [Luteimonas cucumeris]TWI01788.1 hypothetical protein IP90_02348 [Luteimonas cucumeris]
MDLETIRAAFGWAALMSYALLLVWFCLWLSCRNWMHRWHNRWFRLSDERFDLVHYAAMAGLKLAIWVFLLAPWLALHLVR